MNDVLRIARLKIALQRAFLGRAILRVIAVDEIIEVSINPNYGGSSHCFKTSDAQMLKERPLAKNGGWRMACNFLDSGCMTLPFREPVKKYLAIFFALLISREKC